MKSAPRVSFRERPAFCRCTEASAIIAVRQLSIVNQILLSAVCCLTFVSLFSNPVLSQPLPDTLAWYRYYPLAVGNVWEYQVAEGEPLLRREIIGETLALGREYFIMDETSYDHGYDGRGRWVEIVLSDTLYVRYDTSGTVAAVHSIESDTSAVPRNDLRYAVEEGYFDLRTAFGDTVRHGPGEEDIYWTTGGYELRTDVGSISALAPAVKTFVSPFWFESYAADIGYLGGGNLWGPRITYARVNGLEYGTHRGPDTLDWRGYFPLQVGNVWEYTHSLYRPRTSDRPEDESEVRLERYHIIGSQAYGDSLVYSLVFQERTETNEPISRDTIDVWYDESSSSVIGRSVLPGVLDWLQCLDRPFGNFAPPDYCPWWWIQASEVSLFGEFQGHAKGFYNVVHGFDAVHKLGVVFGGGGCEPCHPLDDEDYWSLKYARVDGVEYGEVVVSNTPDQVPELPRFEAYPNPTTGPLVVEATGEQTVDVYDTLGRRVLRGSTGGSGRADLDLSPFAPGLYVVKVGLRSKLIILR